MQDLKDALMEAFVKLQANDDSRLSKEDRATAFENIDHSLTTKLDEMIQFAQNRELELLQSNPNSKQVEIFGDLSSGLKGFKEDIQKKQTIPQKLVLLSQFNKQMTTLSKQIGASGVTS